MNFLRKTLLISLAVSLFACENDVEINDDFQEVTAVVGLLDPSAETQYLRISRTFLDEQQNAIQLAGQPERIYYNSLTAKIFEKNDNNQVLKEIVLKDSILPKQPGFFTQDGNKVYYTDETINSQSIYELEITKDDGSKTTGRVKTTDGVRVVVPRPTNKAVTFVNALSRQPNTYPFEFSTGDNVGEFEVIMRFLYTEKRNNDSTDKEIVIPLAKFTNGKLTKNQSFKFNFDGNRFFQAIEDEIPASLDSPKRFWREDNIIIEIQAADADYTLYRDVNGPLDGLSQTRPEFTNLTEGVGIFASRNKTVRVIRINDDTQNYLLSQYGNLDRNRAKFRGFDAP